MMDTDQITLFLERYGEALSSGDLPRIVSCWEVPALVLADQGAVAVSAVEEIERFFSGAVEYYRSQGLMATRPQVERLELLGARLTSVDVSWSAFDSSGAERTSERSRYILWLGDNGEPKIRVALTLTQ